jgi:hypothetical protein
MEAPIEFKQNYPNYFEPGETCVKSEYLDTLPLAIAKRFEAESKDRKPLTMHQLRAFFQHAKKAQAIGEICRARNEIKKLAFHAQDREAKRKVSPFFREFIERNVGRVNDEDSLRAFLEHFEAVVGFSAGRLRERDER